MMALEFTVRLEGEEEETVVKLKERYSTPYVESVRRGLRLLKEQMVIEDKARKR